MHPFNLDVFLLQWTHCNKQQQSIPHTWLVLDNQLTVDVFCNKELPEDIDEADTTLDIHCNAGVSSTNKVGILPGYGRVWYHPSSIANILSLSLVQESYGVTFNSEVENRSLVTMPNGTTFEFQQSDGGLYYLDTADTKEKAYSMVNMVAGNWSKYTNTDYLHAVATRKLQIKIGNLSPQDYITIIENNLLPNCPFTRANMVAAEHIFGHDVGSIKGKTVRQPPHVVDTYTEPVPKEIMERYQKVTIASDVMLVNGLPFLVTISRNICFGMVEALHDVKGPTLVRGIKHVRDIYKQGGSDVDWILVTSQAWAYD